MIAKPDASPTGSVVLKVSGLRRAYGAATIVDDFDLTVRAGEAVAITGRNGAGKSTLLRCLVGADRADAGLVEINGRPVQETDLEVRRDLATLVDDFDFFPDLSVVEHLDLLARAHGLTTPLAVVDEILEELQLLPQSGQLPDMLSTGQQQRLALATVFIRPCKLLVLDEPEARLDAEGVNWLAERLHEERDKGLAIIFASFDAQLINRVATRVVHVGEPERGTEDDVEHDPSGVDPIG